MTSVSINVVLEDLSLILNVVAVARVIQLRLHRVYPLFLSFLSASLILQSAAVGFGTKSLAFFYTFVVLDPLRNVLYLLVVWELFSVIFRNYAGLRSLSRWVMGIAAAISPIGLILSLAAHGSVFDAHSKWFVPTIVRFERGIAIGLVIFILILLYFISRYPIKLPRNSVVLCMLYSLWFIGYAALLLAASFLPISNGRRLVNEGTAIIEICCYASWALLLSKAGEYSETRVRRDISPEHEQVLIGELNAMNEMLLRAGRSVSHTR